MKKIKIIMNPSSGRQNMEAKIDYLAKLLLDDGYIIGKFLTKKKNDAREETIKTCKEGWDSIVVCGGDGTVNEVASGIAESECKIPVAIMAAGTVNDFANHMKIPQKVEDFHKMIKNNKVVDVDLGKSGKNYFVNVAASGLLTEVGYQVPVEAKAIMGRMAYYFEGLRELLIKDLKPVKMSFKSEEYTSTEEVMLFVVSNSSSIGGFTKLAPKADVVDNLLDVVIIKDSDIPEIANIFFNVLRGEHINHPNVVYFKTKDIQIEADKELSIDIDGEFGGYLPARFEVVPNAMKLIVQ